MKSYDQEFTDRRNRSSKIGDLIERLTEIREDLEAAGLSEEEALEVPVCLAIQPSWPFEHSIGEIVLTNLRDVDNCDCDGDCDDCVANDKKDVKPEYVVYIAEQSQLNYLPGAVKEELGWGRH